MRWKRVKELHLDGNEGSPLLPQAHHRPPLLPQAGNSMKSPQQPLLSPPWGSSIPTSQFYQLSPNPPPWCKCTYPCTPGRYAFCAARTQRGSPRHRFIIFHASACTGTGTSTHIRPSPFINSFPPLVGALCAFSHSFLFSILIMASVAF